MVVKSVSIETIMSTSGVVTSRAKTVNTMSPARTAQYLTLAISKQKASRVSNETESRDTGVDQGRTRTGAGGNDLTLGLSRAVGINLRRS